MNGLNPRDRNPVMAVNPMGTSRVSNLQEQIEGLEVAIGSLGEALSELDRRLDRVLSRRPSVPEANSPKDKTPDDPRYASRLATFNSKIHRLRDGVTTLIEELDV